MAGLGQAGVPGRRAVAACSRPSWEAGLGGDMDVQKAVGSAAGPQEIRPLPGRSPPLTQHPPCSRQGALTMGGGACSLWFPL